MKNQFENFLKECPLIAILRGITPAEIPGVCDVLYNAGFRLLEIPLNTPDPFNCIKLAVKHCQDKMMVGAGTVLTADDVEKVRDSGGKFIISPNTDADVIRRSKECGLLSIPGFFTPTEGFEALKAGADYLKLFPAILGTSYVKDLKAVIKAPIFAVGGVNPENLSGFLQCCAGAGIGSSLYKPGKSLQKIAADAENMIAAVSSSR